MSNVQVITLSNRQYVLVPRAEFVKLQRRAGVQAVGVDAIEHARESIAAALVRARAHAKLTQGELAERLGKSQAMVTGAESGRVRVGERYVASVLAACGLPPDWKPPRRRAR